MSRKLAAIATLAATAGIVAAVAAAGPVAAKQRLSIQLRDGKAFVLTPLTSGDIKPDTGRATFCCWTRRTVVRDGQTIEVNNPEMTLVGKHGTLVARNRIEWVDVPDGSSVFTGTWKIVRATGDYARLTGGGRGAGITLANGVTKSTFQGFVGPK